MSCYRKLREEKLPAEPMMTSFRFSCASKEQYSLYVKAFEVNPMNFTGRYLFFPFRFLFLDWLLFFFF